MHIHQRHRVPRHAEVRGRGEGPGESVACRPKEETIEEKVLPSSIY